MRKDDHLIYEAYHHDPMQKLAQAANQINSILKSSSDDEATPEHIEEMALRIMGPQSEYSSVDEFQKVLAGVIGLLNRYIVVSMNEGEEGSTPTQQLPAGSGSIQPRLS